MTGVAGSFALDGSIDGDALRSAFRRTGRFAVAPFLAADQAEALYRLLRDRSDWRKVINSGETRIFELDRDTQTSLAPDQARALDEAVYAGARHDFQYRYETIRVPDDDAARVQWGDLLAEFARFMSTGPARDLLRHITGQSAIRFADAQATAYSPGDFLTRHDDDVVGKNRIAAYVMSLNPVWRTEWGGLLLMHHADGHGADALVPGFNRLNLFAVPQVHSVSEVTKAAAYRRYSITGWLRR